MWVGPLLLNSFNYRVCRAYGVLRVLFPDRRAYYQDAYERYLATIPAGAARDLGLALGAEVAAGVVALRANDGRATPLPVFVPGTAPGTFRGVDPVLRTSVNIRPFALRRLSQFRPPPPPALDSAAYAADFNQVKAMGAVSASRTPAQFEVVRFHTEQPPLYISRNFGNFARTTAAAAVCRWRRCGGAGHGWCCSVPGSGSGEGRRGSARACLDLSRAEGG